MNEPRESISNDPLDQWLAEARWAAPTAESSRRLRGAWLEISRRRLSSWRRGAVAAAAMIVVVVGVWFVIREEPPAVVQIAIESPPAKVVSAQLPGRAPTARELVLFNAAVRKKAKGSESMASTPPQVVSQTVVSENAIARLWRGSPADFQRYLEQIANSETRQRALHALDNTTDLPTERLIQALAHPRADLRVSAAIALGHIDGPVLTKRLIDMIERDQSRREAFIALASSRGREAQRYVQTAAVSEQYAGIARSAIIASTLQ